MKNLCTLKELKELKTNKEFTFDYLPNRVFTKGKYSRITKKYMIYENGNYVGDLWGEEIVNIVK